MTPAEKRILITRVAADHHEKLLKTNACKRGYLATATWMPVSHLERDEFGSASDQACTKEETEVKLQYLCARI